MEKFEIKTISVDDVVNGIIPLISELKDEILGQVGKNIEVKLLTRKQVAEFFGIDISSVNNWTNKKVLRPIIIEGRRFFDIEDLKDLIEKSKI